MGQGQSQHAGKSLAQARPGTPEPEIDSEERARVQAEERERRAAAAQQRFASQQKKGAARGTGSTAAPKKPQNALEQLSAENRGWRVADENADLRAWN